MYKKILFAIVILGGLILILYGNLPNVSLGVVGKKMISAVGNNQSGLDSNEEEICPDFNGMGAVNLEDFLLLKNRFGSKEGDNLYSKDFDLDKNGQIYFDDFFIFSDYFGKKCEIKDNKKNMTFLIFLIDSQTYPHPQNLKKEDVSDWFFNESNPKSAYNYVKLMSKNKITLNVVSDKSKL